MAILFCYILFDLIKIKDKVRDNVLTELKANAGTKTKHLFEGKTQLIREKYLDVLGAQDSEEALRFRALTDQIFCPGEHTCLMCGKENVRIAHILRECATAKQLGAQKIFAAEPDELRKGLYAVRSIKRVIESVQA